MLPSRNKSEAYLLATDNNGNLQRKGLLKLLNGSSQASSLLAALGIVVLETDQYVAFLILTPTPMQMDISLHSR